MAQSEIDGSASRSRVEQYVAQFERTNDELVAVVCAGSPEQWHLVCPNDGRSLGVVARHVADVYVPFAHIVATLARGERFSPSASMDDVDRENAEHAGAHADDDQTATLALLRGGSAAIASLLRTLRDEQLDGVAGDFVGHQLSVAQVIEYVVIGHTVEHLSSIRAALAG